MSKTAEDMGKAVKDAGICHCSAQNYTTLLEKQFCWMQCRLRQENIEEEVREIENIILKP